MSSTTPGLRSGELKSRVGVDGVLDLLAEDGLLHVVGKLEQVEARGGRGQAAHRRTLADVEETLEHAAHCVPSILQWHIHTVTQITWGQINFSQHYLNYFFINPMFDHLLK